MAGKEAEARVGILTIEDDRAARIALAGILRRCKTVVKGGYIIEIGERGLLTGEKITIVRLAERTWDRNFTVAEDNLIHVIAGRFVGRQRVNEHENIMGGQDSI
jgi:hypothetical protein